MSQQKAVEYNDGHLLSVAGPGTGKTHILTHRIARSITFLNPSEKVLAITFTNKAALELEHRLSTLAGERDAVFIGTFHSFCLQLLKTYWNKFGGPKDFFVALPEEIEKFCKSIWPDLSAGTRKSLLQEISQWKATQFEDAIPEDVKIYDQYLREKNLLDFDDLLLEAVKLLKKNLSLLKEIRKIYRYVCVDEYQDINPAQHALLKLLVHPGGGVLTAIGDPNQAIYGFRGSEVKFFESFEKDFPGAQTLSLEENYRSAQNLLAASSQVVAKSRFKCVSPLTAKIAEAGRLTIYEAPTDSAEAEYVVHQIEKMVGGTSMFSQDSGRVVRHAGAERSFGDIAVLYRLNSQSRALKTALERSGIPYEIAGEKALEDELLSTEDEKYVERSERVSLMTLHAAKGLEFPVVFIVGCEENILPLHLEGMTSDPQEERRLFYVGMTRAKDELFLVRANKRLLFGKFYQNAPSPFLADIEEELKAYEKSIPRRKEKKEDKQMTFF